MFWPDEREEGWASARREEKGGRTRMNRVRRDDVPFILNLASLASLSSSNAMKQVPVPSLSLCRRIRVELQVVVQKKGRHGDERGEERKKELTWR